MADDLGLAGPQYAAMASVQRQAADAVDALVWIAEQPTLGPAASWWDLRAKARIALGLPPIALTPEEREKQSLHELQSRVNASRTW
jgi:hypothetical protein